jgi:hypothetical protein
VPVSQAQVRRLLWGWGRRGCSSRGAVGGAEGVGVALFFVEVEAGAEGVVEEEAAGDAFAEGHDEGDGFVDGVGGFLPAVGVGVPVGEGFVAAVEGAGLVAEAEVVLVFRGLFVDAELGAVELDGAGGEVVGDDGAGVVGDGDAEGMALDLDVEFGGREAGGGGGVFRGDGGFGGAGGG